MGRLVHEIYTFGNKVEKIEAEYIVKVQEKLAQYEDLEEQGLLIKLDLNQYKRDDLDRCTHRHCNNCDKYRRELQKYKDLEEQGRLIEQKHGRWIHKDNFIGKYLMCSECSHVTGRKSNYCPNCGAKMGEVEE